jgi:nitrite reductase/ring-hydroxylating ferredoxin subunit
MAFNNACPHLHLPLFEHQETSGGDGSPTAAASSLTDDLGIVCRWHQSCFDLQTGDIRSWCENLNQDGTSPGMEHLGDISKNRNRLQIFPCRVQDGYVWISLDSAARA